jgi:uncharacterized protein (DUF362 family)
VVLGRHLPAGAGEGSGPASDDGAPVSLVIAQGPGARGDLDRAVSALLAPLGGMAAFVKKGQSVLLKPNLGFPNEPAARATTSPWLVAAVARQALSCGAGRVVVADYPCRDEDKISTVNGYGEALSGLPVKLIIASEEVQFADLAVPQGKALRKTKVLRALLNSEVHIAMPVAKSHRGATFTGAVKGHMGVIWERKIFHALLGLHQPIADLATVIRPQLTILEGIQIMTDGGPVGPGPLHDADTLVAGTDQVAVDAVGVELAPLYGKRLKPSQVQHLKLAEELGVGKLELAPGRVRRVALPA